MEEEEILMVKLVREMTTCGLAELNEKDLKLLKNMLKRRQNLLNSLQKELLCQLSQNHSEIRLSAFQIMLEIFDKSAHFRTLLLENLQKVFDLTLINENLPPPLSVAKKLSLLATESVKKWVQKYGHCYKKLQHGYNYLKQVKRVDFNDIHARSLDQRRMDEEKKKKEENMWKIRVEKVQVEMEEMKVEVENCVKIVHSCVELLIPTPENFLFDEDEHDEEDDQGLNKHGILDPRQRITIDLDATKKEDTIEVTDDNKDVVENLRGQYTLLTNRYVPMVKKWTITLTKAGDKSCLLKQCIDLKQQLDNVDEIVAKIKHLFHKDNLKYLSDSDDDDFEEVPEKNNSLGIPFYPQQTPNSRTKDNAEQDPTTLEANLAKHKVVFKKTSDLTKIKKSKKLDNVVTVPFGEDLIGWEEERKPTQVLVPSDNHRFWSSGASSRDEDVIEVPGSSSRTRVIEFAGKFEAVKWSCRAPLPSGRLCPRHDRYKCPLHGIIVARDNMGNPKDPSDKVVEKENPGDDWQDPGLVRDMKAATGIDLAMPTKKKKKTKETGLTDIEQMKDTSRKRIEKKLFNRSSMKRVASAMDQAEAKKFKHKYGQQFNYMFSK